MSTGRPHHYGHLLQVYKESLQPLTLYTSFHDLINVYSRRSGADNPRGQNFDVNRNLFSLQSFATSFKKISLKSDFIHFFFMILYMYIHVALNQTLLELERFSRISGLNVNFDKTQLVWIGSEKYSTKSIKTKWKLSWGKNTFKILGITFNIDLEKMIKENYT